MQGPLPLDPRIVELLQISGHVVTPYAQGFLVCTPPNTKYSLEYLAVILSVASVLCELPEKALLHAAPRDAEHLIKYRGDLQNIYEWIALAFVDQELNLGIEPLKRERMEGRIKNKWDRSSCEQIARWYSSIWWVVYDGFAVIAEKFPDLAETPLDLFSDIIREYTKSTFSQRKRPYFQNLINERIRYFQRERAFESLSLEAQQKEQDKFLRDPLSAKSITFEAILPFLAGARKSDARIEKLLVSLIREYNSLAEFLSEDALPARVSKGLVHVSEIWKNGEKFRLQDISEQRLRL